MKTSLPFIFKYICYRSFLSDYYRWHKLNTSGYSYRAMAESLGFSSPNFLKLVIDGERNLGKESLEKVTRGMSFNKLETEYFSYLVSFAQAKNTLDKNYYYSLLAAIRSNSNTASVAPEQYEFFSKWYHPAIRELVAGMRHPLDYDALSNTLRNKVSVSLVKKSVALLICLDLLRINQDNHYEHASPVINIENEFKTFAVRNYHKDILDIARIAIDEIEPLQRENSHAIIKTSQEGFLKIKKRIQDFKEEILQLAADDQSSNNIYHVNLQLYPITKRGM